MLTSVERSDVRSSPPQRGSGKSGISGLGPLYLLRSSPMEIQCHSKDELVSICAGLVERGIKFKADSKTLLVVCTGGF